MAATKYYAVRKGRDTGIFDSWEKCRVLVDGCAGAEYKSFKSRQEAEDYLEGGESAESAAKGMGIDPIAGEGKEAAAEQACREKPEAGKLLAYVDGSYDNVLKKYAFGCVFILPEGRVCTDYGNGDKEQGLQQRNVTGEMLGAMYAVRTAMASGFRQVELRYDYEGIEKWVTGQWRSKTELTRKYTEAMREWGKKIKISFTKVTAHSNVYYNELADKMAKTGLREGQGTPGIKSLYE